MDRKPPLIPVVKSPWPALAIAVLIIIPAIVASILVPPYFQAKESRRQSRCKLNVKLIALAIAQYSDDHSGEISVSFDQLRPYYANGDNILLCPSAKDQKHPSYFLISTTNKWDDGSRAAILREINPNHNGCRQVLYNNGDVELTSSH